MIHAFLNHGRDTPSAGLASQIMAMATQIKPIPYAIFMIVLPLMQRPNVADDTQDQIHSQRGEESDITPSPGAVRARARPARPTKSLVRAPLECLPR